MQLASRKDLLTIELNENLRRRREDIRARIDALDSAAAGQDAQIGAGGAEELKGRKNELKKLDKQIDSLNGRLGGAWIDSSRSNSPS